MDLRRCLFILSMAACSSFAQTAVVNGKSVSLNDLQPLVGGLPQQLRDQPTEVFRYYGLIDRLAARAEADKLDERSPYKEQLELQRKQILAQAAADQFFKEVVIPEADLKKFYEEHKADYPNGFEEAKGKIWQVIAQGKFGAWMEEMRKSVTVTH